MFKRVRFTATHSFRSAQDFRTSHASLLQHVIRIVLLLALITAYLPMSANAASRAATHEDFIIPKATVDATIWKAVWRSTYLRSQRVEKLIYDDFLVQQFKREPQLDAQQAASRIQTLQHNYEAAITALGGADASYRARLAYDEIVRTMFEAAIDTPALSPTVKSAWVAFTEQSMTLKLDSASIIATDTAGSSRYELLDSLQAREERVLQSVVDAAQQNPRFADAYDLLSGQAMGSSIKEMDAAKLMQMHAAMYVPPGIKNNLLPNGTVSISLPELATISQLELDGLNNTIINLRSTINTISANQQNFLDYMKDQKKREEDQKLAKKVADENKMYLDARNAAFSIISTFIGFEDAKMGKQIGTILTSYGKIGDALGDWLEATADLKGLDALTSMSTMVMTGNVLAAVMNIVSLFGDSGPTPEQQILQNIEKLRQQIDSLRKEMSARFDRIDQELNVIYNTMQQRFNLIDLQLGKINGNVQEIQRSLIDLDLTLNRIERNNYEFLDAAHRRPLLNAINGAIGYQARTGVPMPYQPDFVDNENVFQTWGTIHAFDALSAGPTQRDFSDAQVLAELKAYPLDTNLNYLNGWLLAHGLQPFANNRLANPRDWTFASRAYAQLTLDWPEHSQRISPDRQAALEQVGDDLSQAMRHISTIDTAGGPQGNTPLFTGVSAYYQSKWAQLIDAIQSLEQNFYQEVQVVRLQRDTPFDLWGGIDQPLTYQPDDFANMRCGNPQALGFQGLSNLQPLFPNLNRFVLADYLKMSSTKLCLTAAWVDTYFDLCTPKFGCKAFSYYKITLDLRINDVSMASRSFRYDQAETAQGDAQQLLNLRWKDAALRARFETDSTLDGPADDLKAQRETLFNQLTTDLETRLAGTQQELYARIFNELSSGSLRPYGVELAGGKALLDSFITLGLPRAIENDDLMRSLLFGNQRLFDDTLTSDTYAISTVQPITQVALMTDTLTVISQTAAARIEALDGLLNEYLDAIGTNSHAEEFKLVDNANLELRFAKRLAALSEPTTPEQPNGNLPRRLFMPLLQQP